MLVSTWNPLEDAEDQATYLKPSQEQHPSSKTIADLLKMDEEAADLDYAELVNSLERHQCTSYCLRSDKRQKQYCRFLFPQQVNSLAISTTIEFKQKKDGTYSAVLKTKRNDPWINTHNRVQLSGWRANVDLQIILDVRACVAYAAKAEKRSNNINQIMLKAITKRGSVSTTTTSFSKNDDCFHSSK